MADIINDIIRDLEVRHQVGIQRLSTAVVRKLIQLLDKADREIVLKLEGRGPTLEGSFTSQRLKYLLRALREINKDVHVQLGIDLRQELRHLARYEVEFQTELLGRHVPVLADFAKPPAAALDAIITSRPFSGKLLRDAVKDLETGKFRLLKEAIQLGMIQGETTEQIVRRVRGTKALNYRDGVMNIGRTAAERMVRTATNHIANASREELFAENRDLIKGIQWVATLDTRTCLRCAALDGKVFGFDRGPRPPYHLNCRCATVPVLKSFREMGFDIDAVPPGTRASMNGQVSETDTFNTWLRRQSAAVQDDALGPTRGALFRRGRLSIDRFVDVRGNQLTLDQLRERESAAFREVA